VDATNQDVIDQLLGGQPRREYPQRVTQPDGSDVPPSMLDEIDVWVSKSHRKANGTNAAR
jgi:hypothetical protein